MVTQAELKAKNTPIDGKRFQFVLGDAALQCIVLDLVDVGQFSGDSMSFTLGTVVGNYQFYSVLAIDSTNESLFNGLTMYDPTTTETGANIETEYFHVIYYLNKIYILLKVSGIVFTPDFDPSAMTVTNSTYNDSYTLKYAPDGWEDDEYKLVRDMQYFGVFRKFAVSELKFVKDGRDFLAAMYEAGGVNSKCAFTVTETTPSGINRNRFTGYIDFSTYKITELSVDVQIIDGSFTDLVLSRKNTEVNLLGEVSVDGDTLSSANTNDVTIPEINIFEVGTWQASNPTEILDENHSLQVDVVSAEFDEAQSTDGFLFGEFFDAAIQDYLAAVLSIQINAVANGSTPSAHFTWSFHLDRWNGGILTEADLWADSFETTGTFPMVIDSGASVTIDILTGDSLVLRAEILNDVGTGDIQYSVIDLKLMADIEALPARLVKMFLYHEAFERTLQHLTGSTGKVYSLKIGRTDLGYDADGLIGAIAAGRYIRARYGLNGTVTVTLDRLFKSLQAAYCVGMGIESVGGVEFVRIEDMIHFFNNTVILNVSNRIAAETIVKEYYPELAFNRIIAGYNAFDYETLGGIYEYNTANKYSTCIKPVDKQLEIVAPYRADMSGVIKLIKEPAENRDVQGESDIFILDTIRDGSNFIVRTSQGFTQAEAESNTDVLLNLMLTPGRIVRRWGSFLRGFLEKYLTTSLIWQTSDKNTKLKSTETGGDEVVENSSILVSTLAEPLWHPEIFTLEVPALENDIELIKENPYGLIQITGTEYGWLLDYKSKNENGKSEFILLRCNTDYVTPGGLPVYPASITINKTITGFPEDLETKFRVTILSSGGGSYYDLTITQGVPLILTNVPYGDYIVTETFIPEGYALTSITGGTFTIDKDNLHFVVDVVNEFIGIPEVVRYGALYNWHAVTDARNIANTGYSVPTSAQQATLATYLGGTPIAGGKLKEIGITYWNTDLGTNDFNFNLRGAGARTDTGSFAGLNIECRLWNDSSGSPTIGLQYRAEHDTIEFIQVNRAKTYGHSIRLIKTTPTADDLLKADGEACDNYLGNDGKYYRTVKIGTQVWVADNIKETKYRNDEDIPLVTSNSTWAALTSGARCAYNNDIANL